MTTGHLTVSQLDWLKQKMPWFADWHEITTARQKHEAEYRRLKKNDGFVEGTDNSPAG